MIYTDPYKTTMGKLIIVDKQKDTIKKSLVMDDTDRSLDVSKLVSTSPVFITGLLDSEDKIPAFVHPIILTGEDTKVVTDARRFIKWNKSISEIDLRKKDTYIRNPIEYEYIRNRHIFTMMMLDDGPSSMLSVQEFTATAYSKWISGNLGNKFHLDGEELIIVETLSMYFYLTLYFDEVDDYTQKLLVNKLSSWLPINSTIIKRYMDRLEDFNMESISDLTEAIQMVTSSIKLRSLNSGVLVNSLSTSFFGLDKVENLAIALEHIPTWLSIIAKSTERAYKNTNIATLVQTIGKRGKLQSFTQEIKYYLNEYKKEITEVGGYPIF